MFAPAMIAVMAALAAVSSIGAGSNHRMGGARVNWLFLLKVYTDSLLNGVSINRRLYKIRGENLRLLCLEKVGGEPRFGWHKQNVPSGGDAMSLATWCLKQLRGFRLTSSLIVSDDDLAGWRIGLRER